MEEIQIACRHCGDVQTVEVDWIFTGEVVHDCPTCGRTIQLTIWRDEWGDPQVSVVGADG